jgi:hypothetical protein
VSDYGVALKLNDWSILFPATKRLLVVLIIMKHNAYVPKLLSHLCVLVHHRTINSKIWKMHEDDPVCFNEEAGELSFGALGRAMLGDPYKNQVKHCSDLYLMIPLYHSYMNTASKSTDKRNHRYKTRIESKSHEVTTTLVFFTTLIREIIADRFTMYDGKEASYNDKTVANYFRIRATSRVIWQPKQFEALFIEYVAKTKKQSFTGFIAENKVDDCSLNLEGPIVDDNVSMIQNYQSVTIGQKFPTVGSLPNQLSV